MRASKVEMEMSPPSPRTSAGWSAATLRWRSRHGRQTPQHTPAGAWDGTRSSWRGAGSLGCKWRSCGYWAPAVLCFWQARLLLPTPCRARASEKSDAAMDNTRRSCWTTLHKHRPVRTWGTPASTEPSTTSSAHRSSFCLLRQGHERAGQELGSEGRTRALAGLVCNCISQFNGIGVNRPDIAS